MVTWGKRIDIAVVLAGCSVFLWRGFLILATAVVLTAAGVYLGYVWRRWRAVRRFRAVWQSQGRDLLLVYSSSPNWKRYVEEKWIPRWGNRAVVLNWSERRIWQRERRPEVALFRAFAGDKHGKDNSLRVAEAELETYLDTVVQPDT
jgi:hypothetical protein